MPAGREDQAQWMRAIAERRDEAAFIQLFCHFAPRVKSFLLRQGADDDQAEEIAQEVMTTAWRKAKSFDPAQGAVSTWIFRIARNRRIDLLRRRTPVDLDPKDPFFAPPAQPDPDQAVEAGERDALVRDAVWTLPEDQREALKLAFYDGLSQTEIAEARNLPLGTVKSRMRLAFSKLRAALDSTGL